MILAVEAAGKAFNMFDTWIPPSVSIYLYGTSSLMLCTLIRTKTQNQIKRRLSRPEAIQEI